MDTRVSYIVLLFLLFMAAGCAGTKTEPPPASTPTAQADLEQEVFVTAPQAYETPSPLPTMTEGTKDSQSSDQNSAKKSPTAAPSPTATSDPSIVVDITEVVTAALSITPTNTDTSLPTPMTTEATPTPSPESAAQDCIDLAGFYGDVTIPDGMTVRQGEQFEKIWRLRNEGTCTWGPGYSLVFAEGISMDAPQENPLPLANPGDIIDVSVILTAPPRGGLYTGNWEMVNDRGQHFGVGKSGKDWIWVQVAVGFMEPTPPDAQEAEPAPPAGSATVPGCSPRQNRDYDEGVLALINDARSQQGLETLVMNNLLRSAALTHSKDMACMNYVDHIGSDGSLWYDRVAAQGFANYVTARENIRVGNPDFGFTPQYVYYEWDISQVHHENMLYPDVSEAGIACVFYPESEYVGYCTAVFARP